MAQIALECFIIAFAVVGFALGLSAVFAFIKAIYRGAKK